MNKRENGGGGRKNVQMHVQIWFCLSMGSKDMHHIGFVCEVFVSVIFVACAENEIYILL